jgi:hypothetical protein
LNSAAVAKVGFRDYRKKKTAKKAACLPFHMMYDAKGNEIEARSAADFEYDAEGFEMEDHELKKDEGGEGKQCSGSHLSTAGRW